MDIIQGVWKQGQNILTSKSQKSVFPKLHCLNQVGLEAKYIEVVVSHSIALGISRMDNPFHQLRCFVK